MSPRRDVSAERRKQILEAAMRVFTRHGYDKARVDDIAQEVGLSKGSLYWYFKSKKELFLALFCASMQDRLAAMREIGAEHRSATDRVRRMASLLPEMMGGTELTNVLTSFLIQHRYDEDVQRAVNDVYQIYLDLLADVIRHGVARGEFRDDLDAEHVAGAMAGAFDGLELQALLLPELDWQTRLDQLVEIFLSGIRREDALAGVARD